jgi:RNA polymerase sigma-70 factor (ECF subfamily)
MNRVGHPAPEALIGREADARVATAIKALAGAGRHDEAREQFSDLVLRHQRRASRIALHYLRDAADADEAVQDAFLRAFRHFDSFRDDMPFEVWFTRILINGCLDRIKARGRRERWFAPRPEAESGAPDPVEAAAGTGRTPEELLLGRERRRLIAKALQRLTERQRLVFVLSQVEGCSSREVGAITGLNESTVRVHLFRAVRSLRRLLGDVAGRQD